MKKALVVLPTYNEAGTIKKLIEDILLQNQKVTNWEIEVLINDSSSTDDTAKLVKELQKKYFKKIYLLETKKEGLGKAYHQAFIYAIEYIQPFVIIQMDADFSHNPNDTPLFLNEIAKGADMVVGARYIKGGSIPKNWGIHRKILSVFANLTIRFGFMKLNVHEWTNGYRAIKIWLIKDALDHIKNYSGYVFQIAMLDYAIKKGAKLAEIPNNFIDRKYGKSKIFVSQYILQILAYIFSHSSFIKFIIVGFIGFAVDFSFAYLFINKFHFNKPSANMFSAEIAIISNFLMNNFWSFKDKKIQGGVFSYLFKFITFNFVSSGSIIIQGVGLSLALRFIADKTIHLFGVANISSWIVYKILIIAFIIIPYSYILYNKVIWKKK
ncbi:MAG: Dolichyl-phosphate beta-D-mannosyltransferase [Candidatus Roizmanbacteria bacterium GW2011_GWC2_34_23]|uniref:Dolichyl-phosphate beta-D-mannosyltransferase n=2 Tax=Candidatus Roizmaniibacteriota TaxID=1752723 RepID=A0A0G0E6Z9_9BACT|nr:MAG: Dolichyl-phosphate beta-D-mannosyltransferase [Candidatus Roizmanbacteria bacterium GW2011_GWC2_34_23]